MIFEEGQPGFYGKIPAVGDFVSRRLPAGFVQSWDAWLQKAMAAGKGTLGERWSMAFLESHVWNFMIGLDHLDENAWAGVVMPSADKVGRLFPFAIAAMIEKKAFGPQLFFRASQWFERVEQIAAAVVGNALGMDALERKLSNGDMVFCLNESGRSVEPHDPDPDDNLCLHLALQDVGKPQTGLFFLDGHLLTGCSSYTFWYSRGSQKGPPSLLVYKGLPGRTLFSCPVHSPLPSGESLDLAGEETMLKETVPVMQGGMDSPLLEAENGLLWESSAVTHAGNYRTHNEDAYLDHPSSGLWVVADGVGGHNAGHVASRAVVDALGKLVPCEEMETCIKNVSVCLEKVNAELMVEANAQGQVIGTTVVLMLCVGRCCAVMWAGDSRLYRYRHGLLSQMTYDHTPPVKISIDDLLSDDIIVERANANIISNALGAAQDLKLSISRFECQPGDMFVLCSDGLTRELSPAEMTAALCSGEPDRSARALVDLALQKSGRDNVTVIVVEASES